MNGIQPGNDVLSMLGGSKGIEIGRLGLTMADVGSGGRPSNSGVSPGIKRASVLLMRLTF